MEALFIFLEILLLQEFYKHIVRLAEIDPPHVHRKVFQVLLFRLVENHLFAYEHLGRVVI